MQLFAQPDDQLGSSVPPDRQQERMFHGRTQRPNPALAAPAKALEWGRIRRFTRRCPQGSFLPLWLPSAFPASPSFSLRAHQYQAATGAIGKRWDSFAGTSPQFLPQTVAENRDNLHERGKLGVSGTGGALGFGCSTTGPQCETPRPKLPKGSPLFYPTVTPQTPQVCP